MSSVLALVLAAGVTAPGDAPEKAMGEVMPPQPFDLLGEWDVTWKCGNGKTGTGSLTQRFLFASTPGGAEFVNLFPKDFTDEGDGKVQMNWAGGRACGIYKYSDDSFFICWRYPGNGRPTAFRAERNQDLLILRRVKPSK
jgi:hypothetical protein